MHIEQKVFSESKGWEHVSLHHLDPIHVPQLVLVFGGTQLIQSQSHFDEIRQIYPKSHIVMCSTAGEIYQSRVTDNTLVATAIHFDATTLEFNQVDIASSDQSLKVGQQLAQGLSKENLVHVLVFSDGLKVNGTALVKGLVDGLPAAVSATGGLVGDGSNFKQTFVGLDGVPSEGKILVIGLYGTQLKVGYGSLGGWDSFGPERLITKSQNNVLFELDDRPALTLYKEYLGELAEDLPGSGLLFPLSLRLKTDLGGETEVVRTLLSVNEEDQSMTFAGDLPEGVYAKLMKANFERLIDGAQNAASMSTEPLQNSQAELALLISCIGRKLVLKERIEEEIEAVNVTIGPQATYCGFYSYGELCPSASTEKQCQLHNQTMTITTFREE
jgi:hypothetical protein